MQFSLLVSITFIPDSAIPSNTLRYVTGGEANIIWRLPQPIDSGPTANMTTCDNAQVLTSIFKTAIDLSVHRRKRIFDQCLRMN